MREYLATFLATVREERGKSLPRYVEEELRRYLRCGILAHGFLRVVCPKCRQEIVVAYSCKCRGACPSCSARRMCDAAAHLVDHVLPDVPVRQWVLTAPHEVRRVLALRPDALTAQGRIFVEEIARWQKRVASADGETGAVTFVQRFDSTLGCFVHFHVIVPDGVFTRADDAADGAVVFREGPAPTRADIADVAARVEKRMCRWLRRRGLLDERAAEDRSNEALELSPLEACMQMSLFGSTYVRLAKDGAPVPLAGEEARFRAAGKGQWVAEASGFNVHAGVTVRSGDREGLERLCRYGARPPFSLERLSILADGRVAYLLRKPRRNGATHLVMTPVQFLSRLASLIPPPRFPLQRLSGVFGPRSPLRASVVPRGPVARAGATPKLPRARKKKRAAKKPDDASAFVASGEASSPERAFGDSENAVGSRPRTSLGDGVVNQGGSRIEWAQLLRRIYLVDVLACPCGGRRAIVADISDSEVVVAILAHLGLPTEAPPLARARSPGFDFT